MIVFLMSNGLFIFMATTVCLWFFRLPSSQSQSMYSLIYFLLVYFHKGVWYSIFNTVFLNVFESNSRGLTCCRCLIHNIFHHFKSH